MTSGKTKPGNGIESENAESGIVASEFATGVLRWQTGPAPVADMCLGELPAILAILCGELGCRVLFGPTEDLTGVVLRVYFEDRSLAMFPRTAAEIADVGKWARGPTVLDDIVRYGDETEARESRRKRRTITVNR